MESFKEIIINSLPSPNNSATRLRLEHVGAVLSLEKLKKSKFELADEDYEGRTTWIKLLEQKSRKITLYVAPAGSLCDLRLSWFVDLSMEGLGSPYGWYKTNDISRRSESMISKTIVELTDSTPPDNAEKEWNWHLERLSFDPDSWDGPKQKDFIICCFAYEYRQTNKWMTALLSISLIRYIKDIINPNVTTDVAHLCGRLQMPGECSLAITHLLNLDQENTAEGWTNIGAVLCDNLREPYAALQCFKRAIKINPHLPQPRQCVWIAGQRLIESALRERNFDNVIAIFDQVMSLGDEAQTVHGIWSYVGLAYESIGEIKNAEQCYRKSLSLHNECATSNKALNRIDTLKDDKQKRELAQQLSWIDQCLEYSELIEED